MIFIAFCEGFEHVVINKSICAQMKVKMWTWREWKGGWYREGIQCVTVTIYPVEDIVLHWYKTLRNFDISLRLFFFDLAYVEIVLWFTYEKETILTNISSFV